MTTADEIRTQLRKASALRKSVGVVRDNVKKVLDYLEKEESELQERELKVRNESMIPDFNKMVLAEKDQQLLNKDTIIAQKDQTLSQLSEKLEVAEVKLRRNDLLITEHKQELNRKELKVQKLELKLKETAKQLDEQNERNKQLGHSITKLKQKESEEEEQCHETGEGAKNCQQELNKDEMRPVGDQDKSKILLESAETQLLQYEKRVKKLEKELRKTETELLTSKQLANETMIREIKQLKQLELSEELKSILSSLTKDTAKIAEELQEKQQTSNAPICSTDNPATTTEKDMFKNASGHLCRLRDIYEKLIERFDAKKVVGRMFQIKAIGVPELQTILSCRTACGSAESLLSIILKEQSESIYKCFLTALIETTQQHIASWISHSDYDIDSKHVQLMQTHHVYLVDNIDSLHSSLIDRLYAKEVIDLRDTERLSAEQTQTSRNEKLLSMLGCKSAEQFEEFLSSLRASGQDYVVDKLLGIELSTSSLKYENVDTSDCKLYVAVYQCHAERDDEISFNVGDVIRDVRETHESRWWHGTVTSSQQSGLFPSNFVESVRGSTSTTEFLKDPSVTDESDYVFEQPVGVPSALDVQQEKDTKVFTDTDNAQLLVTLSEPPTYSKGRPRQVRGVVMLEKFVYVVYEGYNKVEVFDCEDCYKKVEDIEVEGLERPQDMVGRSVTSQLFISDYVSDVIRRVDLKTGVSDVFVKLDYKYARLSMVENRLLVTSPDSLLKYDIHSGERIKKIPYTGDLRRHEVWQAIESNRDSFFVSHGQLGNSTVSEIDSEGREIRVFNNEQQLVCRYLALDSVGRLLVVDWINSRVVLLDEHLKFKRILIDNKRLDNSQPWRLNYDKNNNRLAVGLGNGQVKIFECNNKL